jgi:hypothetical protein
MIFVICLSAGPRDFESVPSNGSANFYSRAVVRQSRANIIARQFRFGDLDRNAAVMQRYRAADSLGVLRVLGKEKGAADTAAPIFLSVS